MAANEATTEPYKWMSTTRPHHCTAHLLQLCWAHLCLGTHPEPAVQHVKSLKRHQA